MRASPLLLATAVVINAPAGVYAQSDVEIKTTNQQAVSEFKLGVQDMQYNSGQGASKHFEAALRADPNFGLARVYWAWFGQLPPAFSRWRSASSPLVVRKWLQLFSVLPQRCGLRIGSLSCFQRLT